jgi:hypothetical protein
VWGRAERRRGGGALLTGEKRLLRLRDGGADTTTAPRRELLSLEWLALGRYVSTLGRGAYLLTVPIARENLIGNGFLHRADVLLRFERPEKLGQPHIEL